MTDIKNAMTAGKEVTISEKEVSFFGWNGAGYIVLDPETGVGGYLIEGGLNGGYMKFINFVNNNSDELSALGFGLGLVGLLGVSVPFIGPVALIAVFISLIVVLAKITIFQIENNPCAANGSTPKSGISLMMGLFAVAFGIAALFKLSKPIVSSYSNFMISQASGPICK